MSLRAHRILITIAAVLLSMAGSTSHAALVFTNGVRANFRFEVVDGPLVPLGFQVGEVLNFVATGAMTFSLNDSVANSTAFTNATGTLEVTSPPPFPGAMMGPHEFVGGQFQNIARDGLGKITGGNVVDLRMRWQMFFGPFRLYTADSLPFNGAMTGAPFQIDDVLAGPDPFNVYLDEGLGKPGQLGGDRLAVIGSNRLLTITAVPEPSSLMTCSVLGLAFIVYRKRRR